MAPPSIGIGLLPVTIAAGTALSGAVNFGLCTPVGLLLPSTWTAASISFQASPDGVNFGEMVDISGAALGLTFTASAFVALDAKLWGGVQALKIRSGTSGAAVNQAVDAIINVIVRPIV